MKTTSISVNITLTMASFEFVGEGTLLDRKGNFYAIVQYRNYDPPQRLELSSADKKEDDDEEDWMMSSDEEDEYQALLHTKRLEDSIEKMKRAAMEAGHCFCRISY